MPRMLGGFGGGNMGINPRATGQPLPELGPGLGGAQPGPAFNPNGFLSSLVASGVPPGGGQGIAGPPARPPMGMAPQMGPGMGGRPMPQTRSFKPGVGRMKRRLG